MQVLVWIIFTLSVTATVHCSSNNATTTTAPPAGPSKTKRGLMQHTRLVGEPVMASSNTGRNIKPILLYAETAPSAPSEVFPSVSQPKSTGVYSAQSAPTPLFGDAMPQLSTQQVLYEFQQTPHTAVSNVHVNQQFKPLETSTNRYNVANNVREASHPQIVYEMPDPPPSNHHQYSNAPAQSYSSSQPQSSQYASQTVVSPVQHQTYIHHPPYVRPQLPPPAKYVYVNGKMFFQNYAAPPLPQQKQPEVILPQQHPSYYHRQLLQQQQNFSPKYPKQHRVLANTAPISFHYKQNHVVQPITEPLVVHHTREPVKQENNGDEEYDIQKRGDHVERVKEKGSEREEDQENESIEEAEDEEEKDSGHYERRPAEKNAREEEDEEEEYPYSRLQTESEDESGEEEPAHYREKEDESDNEEQEEEDSHNRYVIRKPKNFRFLSEELPPESSTSSKRFNSKKDHSSKQNSQKQKTAKHNKKTSDKIIGNQSKNVPIAVHKLYKEKWYLTKNPIPK